MSFKHTVYSIDVNPYGVHEQILESIPRSVKVLEVGCASGYLLEKIQAKGADVLGIEIDRREVMKGRKRNINIIHADIEDDHIFKKLGSKKFDFIIVADVLEHIKFPQTLIKHLILLLARGGQLIISVPNIAFVTNRLTHLLGKFNYTDWGIMDKTHLHFYTFQTITTLLKDCDLDIIRTKNIGNFTQLPLFMQIIFPVVKKWPYWGYVEQKITNAWPEGLAVQFLLYAKIK